MQDYAKYYSGFLMTYEKINNHYTPVVLSKIDSSYAGNTFEDLDYLFDMGITEFIQNCNNDAFQPINIGFNPEEQAWYAWGDKRKKSFKVGDMVIPGDVAYNPKDQHEYFLEVTKRYQKYNNDDGINVTYRKRDNGVEITVGWNNGGFSKLYKYPKKWGHGTWVAKDLNDAKQMAIDYANNLSSFPLPKPTSN